MAKQVQMRRGTTAEHSSFTGAVGELTVDTTKDTVVVHDGATVGGKPMATQATTASKTDITSTVATAGQDWLGVAYVDPDAIGANPTAKIYPDGSIVGSTDNGSYTKWANGDLECREIHSISRTVNQVGGYLYSAGSSDGFPDFPIVFSELPTVVVGVNRSNGAISIAVGGDASTISPCHYVELWLPSSGVTSSYQYMYTAIGKWK